MSLTRHILTSSAQLTVANALARALGIVSLPLLTRWLEPAAYGEAALASTLISLVAVIGLMGMDMSYARSFLSRTPPNGLQAERFCWRYAIVASLATGIVAAIVWLVHAWNAPNSRSGMMGLVFVGASGSLLLAMAQTRSRLHNRHARLALAVAIGGIAATVISLALARWLVADERALMAGYVTAYVLPILIMGVPGWKQLRAPSGLEPGVRKAVFLVGLPGVVTAPMYWVLSSSDRWFLQGSVDSATVGVYAVACTFGQLGMMVNSALLAIWLPEATRLHESVDANESRKRLGALIVRLMAIMMLVWVGVGLLGGDLLRLLSQERFHRGAIVVPWVASAVFFYGCYHMANTGLFLGRRLKVSALVWATVGVLSLAANGLLVPRYGMMAAARVQAVTFALLAIVVFAFSQREHPLHLPYARMASAFAIAVAALALGCRLSDSVPWEMVAWRLAISFAAGGGIAWLLMPEMLRQAIRALRFRLASHRGDGR